MAEYVDVLIVGAGLSGIGAACHLRRECPDKTLAVLEGRERIGGTWDLFRYPGVRSDSDMFTMGYDFKPWRDERSLASAEAILRYIDQTATEYGVHEQIRFGHRVTDAAWDSAAARWTVTAHRADTGERVEIECKYLWMCSGYYRYDEGYTPQFPGAADFAGPIVHPQHWPDELDYAGKQVVVIGSGATAVTLVPSMAHTAGHVTMLQRSPTYIAALPGSDPIARRLRRVLSPQRLYTAIRWKNVLFGIAFYNLCRRRPALAKSLIRRGLVRQLPAGYDVDTDFSPRYDPWDQRMCVVPDGDLFAAIRSGRASVVTDTIERFTRDGIALTSGRHLPADVVVTATGLNLLALGGARLWIDGEAVDLGTRVAYKGMMLSGVPNLALTVGYTNASWTLKADLVAHYLCRLVKHMDAHGYDTVTPRPPSGGELIPLIDLKSGYVLRSVDAFPKQGATAPWRLHQNYVKDTRLLGRGPVDDHVEFSRLPQTRTAVQPA